jgi:hypothetical protein
MKRLMEIIVDGIISYLNNLDKKMQETIKKIEEDKKK